MSASTPLKVMLVEDHTTYRQALTFLHSGKPEIEVVAQAGSVAEAREALDGGGDPDGALDVAVLDPVLPDGDGREIIGELRGSSPDIQMASKAALYRSICRSVDPDETPAERPKGSPV